MAAGLVGCSTSDKIPRPTPSLATTASTTLTPSPSVDPAVAQAEAAVLEAYRGYWAAKAASYADPTKDQDPNLAHFADDRALSDAQTTIFTFRTNGISMPGEPKLSPVVSQIKLGDAPTAMITDCVDATDWQPVYTATGASAAVPGQALRVITESTAFVTEGQWRIRTSVAHRDQTC